MLLLMMLIPVTGKADLHRSEALLHTIFCHCTVRGPICNEVDFIPNGMTAEPTYNPKASVRNETQISTILTVWKSYFHLYSLCRTEPRILHDAHIHLGIHAVSLRDKSNSNCFILNQCLKFKPVPFRLSAVFFSLSFLSHRSPIMSQTKQRSTGGEMTRGKKGDGSQIKRKGRGGGCRHLTSSDQNSEADQVDMKFASNKSAPLPPTPHHPQALLCLDSLYPWGSYHLSLFFMPASSLHTSSNPQPHLSISLKATGSSLLYSVCFLHPSLPLCSYLPLFAHPLHPPSGPLLPLSLSLSLFLSLSLPATDERRNK